MPALRRILLESRCPACAAPFASPDPPENAVFCPDCAGAMPPRLSSFCPVCGEILPRGIEGLCPGCQEQKPPWGKIYFHGIYSGLLRELILRLKFAGQLHLAGSFGAMLAARLQGCAADYDILVPVPLHVSRLSQRGFNQAGEIARALGKAARLPLAHALERNAATRHQVGLSRRERVRNLRGAFCPVLEVGGKKILLLDDVMTTGATLGAAARSLTQAGAAGVDVVVLARTPARNMLRDSRNM